MSHWNGKTVVVTGGTAGLGLAIAEKFVALDANVVSLSRSGPPNELPSNGSDFKPASNLTYMKADVCDDASVVAAVENVVAKFGSIDVWVNNVGKSTRVAFDEASVEDYVALMEVNFFSAVRCSLAALPVLQKSSGSIVNIGSLAAKTGWRNVAPYVTGKHALAGFAHQLRIEGPSNVHSLFVCPGPITRLDADTRYLEQAQGLDASAAKAGAGVKISGIAPAKIAQLIVRALERQNPELVIPAKARLLFSMLQLSPVFGDWILRKFAN